MDDLVLGARVLLALACVCGLIWVLARRAGWTAGRRRPTGPAIQVVGRQALGRHAGVAVVAVGERRVLVGFGEQQVTMLTELDPAEAEDVPAAEAVAAVRVPEARGTAVRGAAVRGIAVKGAAVKGAAVPAAPAADTDLGGARAVAPQDAPQAADTPQAGDTPEAAATQAATAATAAQSALAGSILAPSTWRQALTSLQDRTVRR